MSAKTKVRTNLKMRGSLTLNQVTELNTNPELGETAFKDGILFIYASIGGIETWYPTNRPQSSYVHSQGVASESWTVNHNLATADVIVAAYDQHGHIVMADVKIKNENSVEISFTEPVEGHAVVFGREQISSPALMAADSEKLGGVHSSEYITVNDSLDLGEI